LQSFGSTPGGVEEIAPFGTPSVVFNIGSEVFIFVDDNAEDGTLSVVFNIGSDVFIFVEEIAEDGVGRFVSSIGSGGESGIGLARTVDEMPVGVVVRTVDDRSSALAVFIRSIKTKTVIPAKAGIQTIFLSEPADNMPGSRLEFILGLAFGQIRGAG
jgi:hypothetical protein